MTATSPDSPTRPTGPSSPITTPPPSAAVPAADPAAIRDFTEVREVLGNSCFGCGPDQPHGLQIQRVGHEGATALGEFTVQEAHQGAPGLAHGGVLAAAMDEILGTSAWLLGKRYVTGRLEIDYIAPVPVGARVHLRAWCKGVEGRKAYLESEGRIGGPDGPLAVRAAALFIEVPLEHFTKER